MSAAERSRLGATARALRGEPAVDTRTAALRRRLDGRLRIAVPFAAIVGAPAWLRRPPHERMELARRASLLGIADDLAGSIDGRWLRAFAAAIGPEAIDRVVTAPRPGARWPRFDGAAIDTVAADLLAAALAPELRHCVARCSDSRFLGGVTEAAAILMAAAAEMDG